MAELRINNEAVKIFQRVYKGSVNILTRTILACNISPSGKYVYELSQGRGMRGQAIYGITVVNLNDETRNVDLCKLCGSQSEAMDYIDTL